jgi:cell division protein FtsN
MALLAFAACLVSGLRAENTFSTTVVRALEAMIVTLVIGLIVGAMAQKNQKLRRNRPRKTDNGKWSENEAPSNRSRCCR